MQTLVQNAPVVSFEPQHHDAIAALVDEYIERAGAIQTLRRLHIANPHDVVLAARLAEALTLDDATQQEAYDLLLPLREVLPDIFAFRTMAILLERFGDEGQSDRVLRECLRRTHGAQRGVCRPVS